jgi:hypothetical protein
VQSNGVFVKFALRRLPLCVLSITKRLPNQITVNTLFAIHLLLHLPMQT